MRPRLPRRRALQRVAGLALAAVLAPLAAQPADAPRGLLRLSLDRAPGRLEVGDALVVRLEVWVSTWFATPVDFPATLAAEGALVEEIAGSPDSRFEDIDGRRWTGLVRRYRVLPVQPGEVRVALPAPLRIVPGGAAGASLSPAPPAPLRLSVRAPAGAEDIQPFVAARRLELRQRWWPETISSDEPARVGDLIRREVLLVTDSASPLLPAPDFGTPEGASVRVQAAASNEQRTNAAAGATLTRSQQAVYTLQAPGPVALPPVEFVWWDLTQRRRRVARLDGLTLVVQPAAVRADPFALTPPPDAPARTAPASASDAGRGALAAALATGVLAAGAALWRHRARSASALSPRRRQQQAWRRLRRACLAADAAAADAALRDLLAALDAPTRQRWLEAPEVAHALTDLGRHRFGPGKASDNGLPPVGGWRGEVLWRALRRAQREAERTLPPEGLPALHP